jgi:quercetin dioxygenase-like cupin family protein
MKGPMCIRTSEPETDTVLHPGETLEVPAGRAHTVAGVDGGPCRFLLVQSGGEYDFVGVE